MEEILAKIKNLPGVLGVYLIDPEGDLLYVNSNLDNSPMDLSLLFASLKGYFSQVLELTKLGKFVDTFIDGSVGRILFSNLKTLVPLQLLLKKWNCFLTVPQHFPQ